MRQLLGFSLKNKYFVFFMTLIAIVAGVYSYLQTPLEAFPDVTNTQIIIVTQWNGRSADEMERFVTIPIETAMNAVQKRSSVNSITMFGLSVIKIIFDDGVEDFYARQQVNNLLQTVSLPEGIDAEVQPPYGPTGEIFRYILKADGSNSTDLLTLQDWVIDRNLRSVDGVADIVAFGGVKKTYEIVVNPPLLTKYGMTPLDVYNAVAKSNLNVGGDVIERSGQAFVVRGLGAINNISDIENTIVDFQGGIPVLVRNVATVRPGGMPRVGQTGYQTNNDVVEGIVVMRKGENPSAVLARLKDKIALIEQKILPAGVTIEPIYDRQNLMDYCTETVTHNLLEGIFLVTLIVFIFMMDWRTTLIVALIVPLSLLFAFICMRLKGMNANLLSMGAIDFGIIIDGAVVMVEGLFVMLDHRARQVGMERFNKLAKLSMIKRSGADLAKAIFFSKLIIITCLLPIFAFEKVEGKMFSPLAYTLGFALLGALIFTITLVPVLVSVLLRTNVREKHSPVVSFIQRGVMAGFGFTKRYAKMAILVSVLALGGVLYSTRWLGTEFLPQLNEGALWIGAEFPMSSSLTETRSYVDRFRAVVSAFPEVNSVMSQTGRSNDGTDPNGFYYAQLMVNLKPKSEWKRHITQDQLVDEINAKLSAYPGIVFNYSQPIIDNVAEAVAGFKASFAIKIFGTDLHKLETKANQVVKAIQPVEGIKDLGILRNLGQPALNISLDEAKMAAYGVMKADAQAVIEMAIGGKLTTQLFEEEKRFDIRIRYPKEFRDNAEVIAQLKIPTIKGNKIPLSEIADIQLVNGTAFVYRENNTRFIAVKFSIRGRDMGSTIAEAQERVKAAVKLPTGYDIKWSGEFENQVRATAKLMQVVPISLIIIFIILFVMFGNLTDAGLVLTKVPFAVMGGILALFITHTNFSIASGIGFIALFGICIQNGVLLISSFKHELHNGATLDQAIQSGVADRFRAVVMTAMMAALGLIPAAISTGIGSETQKPLAIVVIGGLVTDTIYSLLVFPLVWRGVNKVAKLS